MVPLIVWVFLLRSFAVVQTIGCVDVIKTCDSNPVDSWTRCYEKNIRDCQQPTIASRRSVKNFIHEQVNRSQQVEKSLESGHEVHIPASVLQKRGRGLAQAEDSVLLVITVLNSSYFQTSPASNASSNNEEEILGDLVLVVKVGQNSVSNLSQPVRLVFKHNHMAETRTCVFWEEVSPREGHWSREGCNTHFTGDKVVCLCDHLSFFAVLVNPTVSLDRTTAVNLTYISTSGSALSAICSLLSLIVYASLQRRRPEKSIGVHMQLTGAILCLHLSFLLGCLWAWLEGGGWPCQVFGALLHWSLLGTFSWTAIEGFHLYILLVRVFNVYIRKYLLKLSLVGWGVPTVIVVMCGILRVYGKFTMVVTDSTTNSNTTFEICWIGNNHTDKDEGQGNGLIYVLMLICMGLVLLFNSAMLGLVVVKLWNLRSTSAGFSRGMSGSHHKWKLIDKEKRSRLSKDLATVMGLSCVLGLAWSFSYTTYSSLSVAGLYLFTILNSLQGVFMFLWSLALTCKSRSEHNSSAQDHSTKKMMATSFNS